jgi:hypothetical protein
MAPFIRPPKSATLPPLTPDEESRIVKGREFQNTGTGYQRIQATKPQTIGAALSDSPVGLLAWIGEKFHEWSDLRGGDGDFSPSVSKDHLITNVMIYLCANTISSSFMFYHYSMLIQLDADLLNRTRITCPSGISAFPREIFVPPRSWCEYWCPNLVQWTEPEKGGHFAALEQPERLIADVRMFGRNPVSSILCVAMDRSLMVGSLRLFRRYGRRWACPNCDFVRFFVESICESTRGRHLVRQAGVRLSYQDIPKIGSKKLNFNAICLQ